MRLNCPLRGVVDAIGEDPAQNGRDNDGHDRNSRNNF